MHDGLILSLLSYTITYLNETFLQYGSLLRITIMMISTLFISIGSLFQLNMLQTFLTHCCTIRERYFLFSIIF